MRKGLILTLILGAMVIGFANTANAASPVIDEIPVIIISDLESNTATQDNNVFEYANAFAFDGFAADSDTADTSLQWSYWYDSTDPGNTGTIQINGIDPLDLLSEDPTTPGAKDLRAADANASYRETTLSPGSASSYADPAAGVTGTIPGFGTYDDIVGDLTVTYYVSDGTAYDFDESFVFTVDTIPGDTEPEDTTVSGPPVLPFTPVTLTGWTFFDGSGAFYETGITSGTTGGLQIIHPENGGGTPFIPATYGGWINSGLSEFNFTAGDVYLGRYTWTWTAEQTAGDQVRFLANPAAGAVDFAYFVNVIKAGHPLQATSGYTGIAYFSPDAEDVATDQHGALYDSIDDSAFTTTLSAFEMANTTKTAMTGGQQAVAGVTFSSNFTTPDWVFANYGTNPPALGVVLNSAGSANTGGNLIITDTDSGTAGVGGAAEWAFGNAGSSSDGSFAAPQAGGGLYMQTSTSTVAGDGSGSFPTTSFRIRSRDTGYGMDIVARGASTLVATTLAGAANSYDVYWHASADDASGGGNLITAPTLQNLTGPDNGGTFTTTDMATYVLTADDPNLP